MLEAVLREIRDAIAQMLPAGAVASAGAIAGSVPGLADAESTATVRMSPRRLQEFSAGRAHARAALGQLGVRAPAVAVGAGRIPQWPAGFVGSISHAGDLVLAVAAPSTALLSIGVDLEPAVPLDAELVPRVCLPGELDRLIAPATAGQRAKLLFSAKESVYKCLAPVTGIFLEFEHVEILFDGRMGRFRALGHGPAAGLIAPSTLTGAYVEAGGYWITAAWQGPPAGANQEG